MESAPRAANSPPQPATLPVCRGAIVSESGPASPPLQLTSLASVVSSETYLRSGLNQLIGMESGEDVEQCPPAERERAQQRRTLDGSCFFYERDERPPPKHPGIRGIAESYFCGIPRGSWLLAGRGVPMDHRAAPGLIGAWMHLPTPPQRCSDHGHCANCREDGDENQHMMESCIPASAAARIRNLQTASRGETQEHKEASLPLDSYQLWRCLQDVTSCVCRHSAPYCSESVTVTARLRKWMDSVSERVNSPTLQSLVAVCRERMTQNFGTCVRRLHSDGATKVQRAWMSE